MSINKYEQLEASDLTMREAVTTVIGKTVFEKLAIDSEIAITKPDSDQVPTFINSVTRIQDGQTVPDER